MSSYETDFNHANTQGEFLRYQTQETITHLHLDIFTEVEQLRDTCKYMLQGHLNRIIDTDGARYNITCIGGKTTRVKITRDNLIDDYSVSDVMISRKTITYHKDTPPVTQEFDITRNYSNGYSAAELFKQFQHIHDLQAEMLVAGGHIEAHYTEDVNNAA